MVCVCVCVGVGGWVGAVVVYNGCYRNEGADRVDGHQWQQTASQCAGRAANHGTGFFGMEYPDPYKDRGKHEADCLVLEMAPTMTKLQDSECENEVDADGNRLGAAYRLALYTVQLRAGARPVARTLT